VYESNSYQPDYEPSYPSDSSYEQEYDQSYPAPEAEASYDAAAHAEDSYSEATYDTDHDCPTAPGKT